MSQIMRLILLVALIVAVSAGVYWWMEDRESGVEETAEELNGAIEELQEPPR
jgi:hypothetical protein